MGAVFVIKAAYVGWKGWDQEGSHIFSSPLLQASAEKENTRTPEAWKWEPPYLHI